ncbi:MAG: DUF1491 family protein [Pseudomonadota bacterium]
MRLTSELWVAAYLRRLNLEGIHAYVMKRGDATAGAVLVKLSTLDGRAVCFQRSFDLETGVRTWMELVNGAEADVEATLSRQKEFDPDLWVIELEDPRGRHLLDEPGLSE